MKTFGQFIRQMRIERGLQQKQVVYRMAEPGKVAVSYMCKIETGVKIPSPEVCASLAQALDVDYAILAALAIHGHAVRECQRISNMYWSLDNGTRNNARQI